MQLMALITKIEIMLKYNNRRLQIIVGLMILNKTKATEIFEVARAMIARGWTIQFSLSTAVIWDAVK